MSVIGTQSWEDDQHYSRELQGHYPVIDPLKNQDLGNFGSELPKLLKEHFGKDALLPAVSY